jgi:hypothetical protein
VINIPSMTTTGAKELMFVGTIYPKETTGKIEAFEN